MISSNDTHALLPQEIAPKLTCGVFGDQVGSQCVCSEPWKQSVDFAFFVERDFLEDPNNLKTLPCDTLPELIQAFYGLAGIFSLLTLAAYSSLIRKRSQLKRTAPLLVGFLLHAIHCFYRVGANRPENGFGVDIFFSITFLLAFTTTNMSTLVFMSKYIKYHQSSIPVAYDSTRNKIKRLAIMHKLAKLFVFIAPSFIMLAIFVNEVPERDIIFRVGMFCFISVSVLVLIPAWYLLNLLIQDVKRFRMGLDVQMVVPNLRRVKNFTVVLHLLLAFFFSLALITNFGVRLLKYVVPILLTIGSFHALIVLYSVKQNSLGNKKEKSKKPVPKSSNRTSIPSDKPAGGISGGSTLVESSL